MMNSSYQLASVLKEADQYRLIESRPRIGISANRKDGQTCLAETYIQAVILAGGAPVVIPATTDLCVLSAVIQELDGILMSGGCDINPLFLNEEPVLALQDVDTLRDRYDLSLIRLASNRQIPIMGICRGHQMLPSAERYIKTFIHKPNNHPSAIVRKWHAKKHRIQSGWKTAVSLPSIHSTIRQ